MYPHYINLQYKSNGLKGNYYGILKITFYVVCNKDLSEQKHPAKYYIWKFTVKKVIVSQMYESTLSQFNELFF